VTSAVDFVAMLAAMRSGRRRECALSVRKKAFAAAVQPVGGWKDEAYGGLGGSRAPVRW